MKKIKRLSISMPSPLAALIAYTAVVLVIILSLKYITIIAAPLLFSFIIAYLINPIVNYLERKTPLSRGTIAGMLMFFLVVVMLFITINIFPYVIDQLKSAADRFPQILEKFSDKMKVISNYITKNFSEYVGQIDLMSKIEEIISSILSNLSNLLVAGFSNLYSFVITLLYLVFIPLFSYYFIKDNKKIQRSVFELVPLRYKEAVILRIESMNNILSSFIRGQAIVVTILAILYSIGLSLIGLPFSVLIGIFAGIGDIIPYFGTILGLILSLIVGFTNFQSPQKILLIILIFALVKGSENWFFYPKIVGKKVGLHFVWVLLAIIIFGKLFGFWGLLIALPASAGFKTHIHELVKYYKKSNFFKKNENENK